MNLGQLVNHASDKTNFEKIEDYIDFCRYYLQFVIDGLQAVIVSRNESHYRFYQYKHNGNYNITRPINSSIMISANEFDAMADSFLFSLLHIREIQSQEERDCINRIVYTCQQAIGATLDALPAGRSNNARKINGDLFERFIRLIISEIGIPVRSGTMRLPVIVEDVRLFDMSYQHDLIIEKDGKLAAIGSVKTSSKDRLDKIFIDKFLHNRLTGIDTPYFAVFLNDVQRSGREPNYGVSATFLPGHFKGYTIKLKCSMVRSDYATAPLGNSNVSANRGDRVMLSIEEIRSYVVPVIEKYPIEKVILIGSHARGDATSVSDVDLIVDSQGRLLNRKILALGGELLAVFPVRVDVYDILEIANPSPMYDNIMKEGVVIYDSTR